MPRYRSKVVEIEALQWNGIGFSLPLPAWLAEAVGKYQTVKREGDKLLINTLEGTMTASPTDWIIRGTEGELYPCKDSVFQRKYEAA